ncbi:MAG: energy-coupling factor transporter ATPase [Brevefilum sp.]|nr:energy-coupling factor transporter ATPase [Brevefilum sp.]MDT8380745.1 energy-coupling factor transporter ATPase [Brevefilum sp.]MDW7754263.1 energy-coupling factor transporter ATPase [Brevefilum sp.]
MINIEALSFKYPNISQYALENVDCQIEPGTLTLIIGPSGSGKSTFLRCINGLVPHFSGGTISGKIDVFGSDPITDGPETLAANVGFVFQEPEAQFVFDIVEDEIAFSLENMGVPRTEMHARVDDIIERLELSSIRHRSIHEISGGEKQKVAIASVLVTNPKVLLLDEPTSQLDPISANQILKLCVHLKNNSDLTIMISEHRLERLLPYTDKVIEINDEHKLFIGSPEQIIPHLQNVPPVVAIGKKLGLNPLPLTVEGFPDNVINNKKPGAKLVLPVLQETNSEPILEIKHLSAQINQKAILDDISFNLKQSEILVLLGKNGSGKTSLLRSILGLMVSMGEKYFKGQNFTDLPITRILDQIGYLPQNPSDLLFAETILDELKITLKNHGLEKTDQDLIDFLQQFNLAEKSHQYPRDLSVGERQRIALAAITVHDPDIIFLDEPTRGLDYAAKDLLSMLFKDWRDSGKGILLITHDVEFAADLADRVTILEGGKIIFTGSPSAAFSQFPAFQTQTARLFNAFGWILPEQVS